MIEASRIVLDGFELRSDAEIVRHPELMWGAFRLWPARVFVSSPELVFSCDAIEATTPSLEEWSRP